MGNNKSYDKVIIHPNHIKNSKQLTALVKSRKIENERIYLESPKCCKQCFKVLEYEDRTKEFCNRSCASIYSNINRVFAPKNDQRTKKGNCKKCNKEVVVNIRASSENIVCEECKEANPYNKVKYKKGINKCKFCTEDVVQPKMICTTCRDNFKNVYSFNCRFDFPLSKFVELFDFELIKKHGWYKAKNKGNNLCGVSRDHKFSITSGFKNKIDPLLMKHPCNCQLLLHKDNQKKRHNCSISLEQLIKEVIAFEKKYNYCPEVLTYIKTLNTGDVV